MRLPRGLAFVLLSLLPFTALPACANEAVLLHPQRPDQVRLGSLLWRGGIALDLLEGAEDLGGLSAIEVSADGSEALAVSDRGRWFRLRLDHDARGNLASAALLAQGPLAGPGGHPLTGAEADA
ncbi:MAG: hypothetical protein FJX53_13650, partial [Alphaproteobacteria bacterium]|nr:hypothetical protein [Alphaproteobacteria bacterium]